MRKVLSKANNNQVLNEVVSYDDLTSEEKDMLVIPATDELEDYANFQVRHNKQGKLLGVKGHDYTVEKSKEIAEQSQQPNIVDLYVAYGESETPIKRSDRAAARNKLKRAGVADKARKYVDDRK